VVDHGVDRVRSAERLGGLGVLAAALLGQGAGFSLASRVYRVACCASCNVSTGVGGRP